MRARHSQGAKAFEKAEDPIYALDHNLPIDCQHYLEHHVKQPLLRIFEPVLKNPQAELLQGDGAGLWQGAETPLLQACAEFSTRSLRAELWQKAWQPPV